MPAHLEHTSIRSTSIYRCIKHDISNKNSIGKRPNSTSNLYVTTSVELSEANFHVNVLRLNLRHA